MRMGCGEVRRGCGDATMRRCRDVEASKQRSKWSDESDDMTMRRDGPMTAGQGLEWPDIEAQWCETMPKRPFTRSLTHSWPQVLQCTHRWNAVWPMCDLHWY